MATVADAALEDEVVSLVGPHVRVALEEEIRSEFLVRPKKSK